MVQYPLPGAYNKFKSEEEVKQEQERVEKEMEEVVALNKRSDFLAMALGKYCFRRYFHIILPQIFFKDLSIQFLHIIF